MDFKISSSVGTIRVYRFRRSAKRNGGYEPIARSRAAMTVDGHRYFGPVSVTRSIAVASLLETITVKDTEKDSILASVTEAPLEVRKKRLPGSKRLRGNNRL